MGQGFEDLEVWQRSKKLCVQVCREMEPCRNFALRDQILRSAISVPSNIAEGAERNSTGEFVHFIGIARGSAGELRTQLVIARELRLLEAEKSITLEKECSELSRMLFALARSLKSKEV